MAVTSKNTPYVLTSDLVSAFPTSSLALANHIDANLSYNAATINAQTGTTYTFDLADATLAKVVTGSNAAAQTYTVVKETTTAWPSGSVLTLINIGAGAITIVGASGVTVNNATAVVSQWESVVIVKTGTDTWTVVRGGGLPKASYGSQIGAASVDTTTRPGKTIVTFNGSGSITAGAAGLVEMLVLGGGGGGAAGPNASSCGGGGGGGGYYYAASTYLPPGTVTVTIGSGGAQYNMGNASQVGNIVAPGGGRGGGVAIAGQTQSLTLLSPGGPGASGGGSNFGAAVGASNLTGYGFAGGTSPASSNGGGGGGGGAGAVGGNAAGQLGGAGGAGATSSITGSAIARGGGGGGGGTSGIAAGGSGGGGAGGSQGNGTAGASNLGGGGGGGGVTAGPSGSFSGAAGGSGLVIIVFG